MKIAMRRKWWKKSCRENDEENYGARMLGKTMEKNRGARMLGKTMEKSRGTKIKG